ncbi:MAG: methylenetetrahydrofolate reductase [NAD(P)H] [Myxococcota bacterium]
MQIAQLYQQKRPVVSFEFFPPKTDKGVEILMRAVTELSELGPDYISVTCPLEKGRRSLTFTLVARIQNEFDVPTMAHLVTVHYSRDEVRDVLAGLRSDGIENLLALRGDLPDDGEIEREFAYASDLARVAREQGFSVGGAAHPEQHPDSADWDTEMLGLRRKVEAGCEFLVTQLFFDNADYFDYVDRARTAGIEVPIVAGIMPITSLPGIRRMAAMNGNRIPQELEAELEAAGDDPKSVEEIGVRHATAQCEALLDGGAPGIHFFTLNRSPSTRRIFKALQASGRV